jgi:hypothetical protein
MEQEIQVLEENNTSTLEPLREGKKWVDCRLVYKIIHKANGEIEKNKAQLVAKDFVQVEGEDF